MVSCNQIKNKMLRPRLPTQQEKRKKDGAEKKDEEPYPISTLNLI